MSVRKQKLRVNVSFERFHNGAISRRIVLNLRGAWARASRHRRSRKSIVARTIGLMLLLAPAQYTYFSRPTVTTYAAQTAQRVILQDGSSVLLDANTELRATFARGSREVKLLRGEALFSVAHNRRWPFRVYAGTAVVRAVGTAFSVKLLSPENVEVFVTQGRVEVSHPVEHGIENGDPVQETTLVSAGDEFSVSGDRYSTGKPIPAKINDKLGWTTNSLTLRNRQLSELVREINRYNPIRLEIVDPSIAGKIIGGTVVATDPEGLLRTLPGIHHVSVGKALQGDDGTPVIRLYSAKTSTRR
jgi:transmembrane sensor